MTTHHDLRPNWTPGDLAYWLRYILGDSTEADEAEHAERSKRGPWWAELEGVTVHDRRDEVRGKRHKRGRPRPPLPWPAFRGVTVHQTASGNLDADHGGLLSVPATMVIHRDASLSLLHPLNLRMPHAHALNGLTCGIEVDCRAFGIVDNPRTFWRRKSEKAAGTRPEKLAREATQGQLKTLEKAILFCRSAQAHHDLRAQRLTFETLAAPTPFGVYYHSQGHKSRTTDPGQRIAMWCDQLRLRHGWDDVSAEHYGSGRPVIGEWKSTA